MPAFVSRKLQIPQPPASGSVWLQQVYAGEQIVQVSGDQYSTLLNVYTLYEHPRPNSEQDTVRLAFLPVSAASPTPTNIVPNNFALGHFYGVVKSGGYELLCYRIVD